MAKSRRRDIGSITQKVVLITGGGSGIGAAMARKFADEGVETVIVSDIDGHVARGIAELDSPDVDPVMRSQTQPSTNQDIVTLSAGDRAPRVTRATQRHHQRLGLDPVW